MCAYPKTIDHGRYIVMNVVGEGGFGVTYKATDTRLGNLTVAVKESFPKWLASRGDDGSVIVIDQNREDFKWANGHFMDEARILKGLEHPHIVWVLEAFSANRTAYFSMEFLKGRSLKTLAGNLREWPEARVRELMRQILGALDYLHNRPTPIFHRDIKPDNIMILDDGGDAVLIDFGSAKQDSTNGINNPNSIPVQSKGFTPYEQLTDPHPYLQSDIYSFGATLYFLLTGAAPPDSLQRNNCITHGAPDPIVKISQNQNLVGRYSYQLLRSIDWALEMDLNRRPASARQWWASLFPDMPQPPAFPAPGIPKRVQVYIDAQKRGGGAGGNRGNGGTVRDIPHQDSSTIQSLALFCSIVGGILFFASSLWLISSPLGSFIIFFLSTLLFTSGVVTYIGTSNNSSGGR